MTDEEDMYTQAVNINILWGKKYSILLTGGGWRMDEVRLFSVVCNDRTRNNGLKFEHRKSHTSTRTSLQQGWQSTGIGCP